MSFLYNTAMCKPFSLWSHLHLYSSYKFKGGKQSRILVPKRWGTTVEPVNLSGSRFISKLGSISINWLSSGGKISNITHLPKSNYWKYSSTIWQEQFSFSRLFSNELIYTNMPLPKKKSSSRNIFLFYYLKYKHSRLICKFAGTI